MFAKTSDFFWFLLIIMVGPEVLKMVLFHFTGNPNWPDAPWFTVAVYSFVFGGWAVVTGRKRRQAKTT
jgi:hypothetical protein